MLNATTMLTIVATSSCTTLPRLLTSPLTTANVLSTPALISAA